MIHFLVAMSSPISLPPQSSCGGLDEGDDVVVPLDGGHSDRLCQVLGVIAGAGEDYNQALLLSCFESERRS